MYQIITTPDPILVAKSEEVKSFDKKLKKIIDDMSKTLLATTDPVGVGLAAPQIGLNLRLFLTKPTEKSEITTFINPKIVEVSNEEGIPSFTNSAKVDSDLIGVEAKKPKKSQKKLLEGCLSIPNIWGNVSRKKSLTLSYYDEKGHHHKKKFSGFMAVIIQHELDHLNGILFTKHVLAQGEKLYKSHKNEKGEDEFDEIKI